MSNLVTTNQTALTYTKEQVGLIKSQIAPKATDDELKLFLYQCQRTGLDALSRQIYAIHRKDGNTEKMTIQTSIDGFRVIAERSGEYAGQDEPVFIEENGKIVCCKVTVYKFRGAMRYQAAVGVAYWDEYVQEKDEWRNNQKTGKKVPAAMWAKMPHTMIAKVAEALALRKAFPQDLSGLYTGDEMDQAQPAQEPIQEAVVMEPAKVDPQQMAELDHSWFEAVEACTSKQALINFYNKYRADIDGEPRLKKLIADRRNQLQAEPQAAS